MMLSKLTLQDLKVRNGMGLSHQLRALALLKDRSSVLSTQKVAHTSL